MKLITLLMLLMSFQQATFTQGVKPRNVYRVTVTSRYVIENGERTSQSYAVNQEIYDSLGRLHTEVDYDWETQYPGNYRWHYYDSMLLVRTQFFLNEQLDHQVVFEYDVDMTVLNEFHYKVMENDTVPDKTLRYQYNEDQLPVQIDAMNESGRRLYRVRSVYDSQGMEVQRRVNGRRGDPDDGIRRLDREPAYDSLGNLINETVLLRMSDRSRQAYTKRYKYDDQGKITGIAESDQDGNQLNRIEYIWQQNRERLSQIRYYDADDNLEKFLAKRYEIYRSADRRQRVIEY